MDSSFFSFFSREQIRLLRDHVLNLLEEQGVQLDEHPEMFQILSAAGAQVDDKAHMVRFPRRMVEKHLEMVPKKFILGARNPEKTLPLPHPDGSFYARTGTGAHGWIDPETTDYRKVTRSDLAHWAKLVNHLDQISFIPFLFANDVPNETADVHGLSTLLNNTDKHVWVQPYSIGSIPYLLKMAELIAGGKQALKTNPVISIIACSLTPRCFKDMDIEIILQSGRASIPIHACSLPGAGGTAPVTVPGVILLAAAEIIAMAVMAQSVAPGTPVIASPIIFSMDMQSGRSLQSSADAQKAASGANQLIKAAFQLPTHNYGSGTDAVHLGAQSQVERTMLSMLMALSGSDILGGAGQLETATAVSPLQLIIDDEILATIRHTVSGISLDDDQLALKEIAAIEPSQHFLMNDHTLKHCRTGYRPHLFFRQTRDKWAKDGKKGLMEKTLDTYRTIMAKSNPCRLAADVASKLESICHAADAQIAD